jgi:DNA polymerase elongation subunit (family B)
MTEREIREKIESLDKEINESEKLYNYYKAMQLALKLVINGAYGAFAHPKSVISNKHIANAITAHGRDVILFMLTKIENYFYNKWHDDHEVHELLKETYVGVDENQVVYMLDKNHQIIQDLSYRGKNLKGEITESNSIGELLKDWNLTQERLQPIKEVMVKVNHLGEKKNISLKYKRVLHNFQNVKPINGNVIGDREEMSNYDTKFHEEEIIIYGDTDSVDKNSVIKTEDGDYTIEELYKLNEKNGSAGITLNGHESVKTKQKVLNWSKEKGLYYAPIKRIIKHKVKKAKWKLKTKSGKEILVTNDHSMIVFREDKKMKVKPSEILKTDKILTVI